MPKRIPPGRSFSCVAPILAPVSGALTGGLDAELLCVLGVQSPPAAELHRVAAGDAADGRSAEEAGQDAERNVPPGGAHGDESAIEAGPQRQARAAGNGLEFPPHVVVLEHL